MTPVFSEEGDITRWVGIANDVTKRREAQQALEQAKEAAEAASRAKGEFLANVSHEIRTPMNVIIGMTELTLGTRLTPEQREYLSAVKNSAEALLRLLNDVLDLSKIEAGKLQIEAVPFSLPELVQEVLKLWEPAARQKKLQTISQVAADLPPVVAGDPVRLRQILFNLVDNAIKFTEQGEVVVTVALDSRTGDEARVHFAVRDTGIGIPEHKLESIFEAFSQADSSTSRRYGGTGLGLTISAQLVALLEGRLWVESQVGSGSAFHFCLPLTIPGAGAGGRGQAEPPPRAAARQEPLAGPGGRRQPGQSPAGRADPGKTRPRRVPGGRRPRGAGHDGTGEAGRRRDGRPDAGDGRPAGHAGNPPPRKDDRNAPADHRPDRLGHERRPGTLPGGGHGRLHLQADQRPGTAHAGRDAGLADAARPSCRTSVRRRPAVHFDFRAALARLEGDVEIFKEQVVFFLRDAPGLLAGIQEALAAGDADRLRTAAHRLKGLAASFRRPGRHGAGFRSGTARSARRIAGRRRGPAGNWRKP